MARTITTSSVRHRERQPQPSPKGKLHGLRSQDRARVGGHGGEPGARLRAGLWAQQSKVWGAEEWQNVALSENGMKVESCVTLPTLAAFPWLGFLRKPGRLAAREQVRPATRTSTSRAVAASAKHWLKSRCLIQGADALRGKLGPAVLDDGEGVSPCGPIRGRAEPRGRSQAQTSLTHWQ